jgi:hypothetical protein
MKNDKNISTRKLSLSKETLRHLDAKELRQAAGGISGLRCTWGLECEPGSPTAADCDSSFCG